MTDPIIAYRGWDIEGRTLTAQGYNSMKWFVRKPMVATCYDDEEHETNAPDGNCSCGLHAFKDLATLHQVVGSSEVLGRVALWGRIIEHEHGYRAEYAYPQVLFYGKHSADETTSRGVAQLYGIDVMPVPQELIDKIDEIDREKAESRKNDPAASMYDMMMNNLYGSYTFNYRPRSFMPWRIIDDPVPQRPFSEREALEAMGFKFATTEEVERYGGHR